MINDLIENLKVDGLSDTVPCDTLSDVPAIECSGASGTDDDAEELAFNRSNTVETIKPVTSNVPIRARSIDPLEPADDYRLNDSSDLGIEMDKSAHVSMSKSRIVGKAAEIISRISPRVSSAPGNADFNFSHSLTHNVSICECKQSTLMDQSLCTYPRHHRFHRI